MYKPMYCSREYQASTRLIQQYEKSTLNYVIFNLFEVISKGVLIVLMCLHYFYTLFSWHFPLLADLVDKLMQ